MTKRLGRTRMALLMMDIVEGLEEGYKSIGKGDLGAAVVCQDIGRHNAAETPP